MSDPWAKKEGRDLDEKIAKEKEEEEKKKKKGKDDKGIWETDKVKKEAGYKRFFKFGNINKDVQWESLLEKQGNSWKSWKKRYFCIHYNYLIYYVPGGNFQPLKAEEPKGWINLADITDVSQIKPVPEKTTYLREFMFQIPTIERVYLIAAAEQHQMNEWIDELKKQTTLIKDNNIVITELLQMKTKMDDLQKAVPREAVREMPAHVDLKDIPSYTTNMKTHYDERRKYLPLANRLKLFAEFRQGSTKLYLDWFVGSDGFEKLMTSSEDAVLGEWRSAIDTTNKKLEYLYEERFFKEDMKDLLEMLNTSLKLITYYRDYNEKVLLKQTNLYDEIEVKFKNLVPELDAYPSCNDINFDRYEGGSVSATTYNSTWSFNKQNGTLNCDTGEFPDILSIKGGVMTSMKYGTVLWNGSMWVWFHPAIPFTLRFWWYPDHLQFEYLVPKKPTKAVMAAIVLLGWKYDRASRVLTSVDGEGQPIIPITSWKSSANLPPPILLTVAIIPHIRNIVRGMLGMIDF